MEGKKEELTVKSSLRGQIDTQLQSLTTKLPAYAELNEEGKSMVDSYIAKIDLSNPETIDRFGTEEAEKISEGLDTLIGTLATHDVSIDEMFTELMMEVNGKEVQHESFMDTLKKSPIKAIRRLANKPKEVAERERYRRAHVLTNISTIQERIEGIRNELKMNVGKLEFMAQNSVKEYTEIQYQLIALQEVLRRMKEEEASETGLTERTFMQIDQSLQRTGAENRIIRKMNNCQGISINAATKAIMARLIAIHNEELAADYEQDLTSLLPELKGLVVMAGANDSLMQAADIHNQFVQKMNQMLKDESKRSKEAIEKVQSISSGSVIDVETAQTLTENVLSVVRTLKDTQKQARPTNDAFTEILSDFRAELTKELDTQEEQEER